MTTDRVERFGVVEQADAEAAAVEKPDAYQRLLARLTKLGVASVVAVLAWGEVRHVTRRLGRRIDSDWDSLEHRARRELRFLELVQLIRRVPAR